MKKINREEFWEQAKVGAGPPDPSPLWILSGLNVGMSAVLRGRRR